MSIDLSFWRYNGEPTRTHSDVYALLSDGNVVEGLEELPISDILQSFEKALASWNCLDETHFEKNGEVIEVYTTSQFVRIDCYGASNENMNLLIDIMLQYDCPLYDSSIDVRFDERTLSLEEASVYYFSRMVELLAANGFKRQSKSKIRRKVGKCIQEVTVIFDKRRGENRGFVRYNVNFIYEETDKLACYLSGVNYRKGFSTACFSTSPWFHKEIPYEHNIYDGITEKKMKEFATYDYKTITEIFLPILEQCDTPDKFYKSLEQHEIVGRSLVFHRVKEWVQIAILLLQGQKEEALAFYDAWEPYHFHHKTVFSVEEKMATRVRIENWEKVRSERKI